MNKFEIFIAPRFRATVISDYKEQKRKEFIETIVALRNDRTRSPKL